MIIHAERDVGGGVKGSSGCLMAYDIEVISIGADYHAVLEPSVLLLNAVQNEFRFRLPSQALRDKACNFHRVQYSTSEIWTFLKQLRADFGGNRPYIIAFVATPLQSSKLSNIFGAHEAADGLAAVTLHTSTQYVRETRRFCCYYMTRYSLSFVNPLIKAHSDPQRKNCYFHSKLYKPDILASMDSGYICDEDQAQLDNPKAGDVAKALSHDEREALRRMRQVVSGDYPYALVMKGGGVKGLAFAGALVELERFFWFDRHVGASAGAIAAVLLGAGYSPAELAGILAETDFRKFMDAPLWKLPINLFLEKGLYPGEYFRQWIDKLLRQKIIKQAEICMKDLNGTVIYASRRGSGTLVFDSMGDRRDTVASFATRCSMSIPIFFVPKELDGRRVYDGGLRNNFPVRRFLQDHPSTPFIALYLTSQSDREHASVGKELVDIWIDGEDRETVDDNTFSVVTIDTSPIGTVDFNLQPFEKDFLLKVGKASALKFVKDRNLDDGPDEATVSAAYEDAETCRHSVIEFRRRRRSLRRVISGAVLLACLAIGLLVGQHTGWLHEILSSDAGSPVTIEGIALDFNPRSEYQYLDERGRGCTCSKDTTVDFPDGQYNVRVNQEFLFRYDASQVCRKQAFKNFNGKINWGTVLTTNLHDFQPWTYWGIAGTLKVKFAKSGNYDAHVTLSLDCVDAGPAQCSYRCGASGKVHIHVTE
jgi:predicted acylesterase/phospholipase RssA